MNWTEERCEQLDLLERLLHRVAGINKTTDALGQIQRCIAEAEQLTAWDLGGPASFMRFLHETAIAERRAAAEAAQEQR